MGEFDSVSTGTCKERERERESREGGEREERERRESEKRERREGEKREGGKRERRERLTEERDFNMISSLFLLERLQYDRKTFVGKTKKM